MRPGGLRVRWWRAGDITQQRREREEREVLHRQYMDLVDNSPDAIARLDAEGRYVFVTGKGRS
jgi:PAS domain-containing protein